MIGRRDALRFAAVAVIAGCRDGGRAGATAVVEDARRWRPNEPPGPTCGLVVRPDATTPEAVALADRRATEGGGTLELMPGDYVLATTRLTAPAVRFLAGAVVRPRGEASLITFDGRIDAARNRIFLAPPRTSGAGPAIAVATRTVYPEWWGATAGGPPHQGYDDSLAWQQALDSLAGGGGGKVVGRNNVTYPLRYPIFVLGRNVGIDLAGGGFLTDLARKNRAPSCVLLIGDSREWNSQRVRERRNAGDLFNNFENPAYVDIGMLADTASGRPNIIAGTFPAAAEPGTGGFTSRGCWVANGRIDYYDDVAFPGNYGVQFCNAAGGLAQRLRMTNVGQGFGFGSDVAPRVPYATGCRVRDVVVEQVNRTHTYYGAGFHGYARNCHDENVVVLDGATTGSPDGNLWAANFALDCTSTASGGVCGRGTNGEGFAIGAHARRCTIDGAIVREARRAFVNFGPLNAAASDGSSFANCDGQDVDYLISLQSRNARFQNVRGNTVQIAEVLADNVNATGNVLAQCDTARIVTGSVPLQQVRAANTFIP